MYDSIIKCNECIHSEVCKYKNQASDFRGEIQKASERIFAKDSIFTVSCNCSLFSPQRLQTTRTENGNLVSSITNPSLMRH